MFVHSGPLYRDKVDYILVSRRGTHLNTKKNTAKTLISIDAAVK